MDFNFTRQSLAVQGRTDKDFWQPVRPPTLDLNKCILFDDIGHLFLLLLALVDLLLKLSYLFGDGVKAVAVR